MLKPNADPMQDPAAERPIGEVVHQLIDEGKAYAKAEVDLAKAQALAQVDRYKIPAALLFGALLFAQAAVTVLAVTVVLTLTPLIGPLGAGLIGVVIAGGTAGLLVWLALQRLKGSK